MFSFMLFGATFFLAFSNGANDIFKGVATLFGSKVMSYRQALIWALITAFAGSLCSLFFAESLVNIFTGRGIVPTDVASSSNFILAIAIGAGVTVFLASKYGFPISTTHALIGALLGAGVMAVGLNVNMTEVGNKFFVPLVLSPILAILLGAALYQLLHSSRLRIGLTKKWANDVDEQGSQEEIRFKEYEGSFLGIKNQRILDGAHIFSAGAVCFARSLNNTPKFVALLIAAQAVGTHISAFTVILGMSLGGLFYSRRLAETMGKRITHLNHGQGFAANFSTALLVIFASKMGLPVSTTHVSVGSLFGIAMVKKRMNKEMALGILTSWGLTLPLAAFLSSLVYSSLN